MFRDFRDLSEFGNTPTKFDRRSSSNKTTLNINKMYLIISCGLCNSDFRKWHSAVQVIVIESFKLI